MYVARPLSEYRRNPDVLSQPPDGPNSGFMVIQDEESETYSCFGLCKNTSLEDLPFPQNKSLAVRYFQSTGQTAPVTPEETIFHTTQVSRDEAIFIPVLDLPLSSNRYYAIKPNGKNHKGEAFTCSRDEDMRTCCFCQRVKDIKPKPFDSRNVYQQFIVDQDDSACASKGSFYAKSVAPDGYPPYFMRRRGWTLETKTPKNYKLGVAPGLDAYLRACLPSLDFSPSCKESEAVVVGKWYTPFVFVKEGVLSEQVKRSPFYEVTLEQKWEQIFFSQNDSGEGKAVNVDASVEPEMVFVNGSKGTCNERNPAEGPIWFRSFYRVGEDAKVGLAVEVVQRMKWEQERGGWINDGKERLVKVERSEKFEGNGFWREFGCYVLVESFVFKRMDASVALKYDFKHTQQIRSIWNQ